MVTSIIHSEQLFNTFFILSIEKIKPQLLELLKMLIFRSCYANVRYQYLVSIPTCKYPK